MKAWINAELLELDINQTEQKWTGSEWDGYFFGRYTPTPTPTPTPMPTPTPPEDDLS